MALVVCNQGEQLAEAAAVLKSAIAVVKSIWVHRVNTKVNSRSRSSQKLNLISKRKRKRKLRRNLKKNLRLKRHTKQSDQPILKLSQSKNWIQLKKRSTV